MDTYRHQHEDWETVVGDEKQKGFKPRLKIKKWDNEVNFSIGLKDDSGKHSVKDGVIHYETDDKLVKFYPQSPTPKPVHQPGVLRYLNLGAVSPERVAAEYELSRHIKSGQLTIKTYYSGKPALMLFGQYEADSYLGEVDIPLVRAASWMGNPYYMDSGLAMIDIHLNGYKGDVRTKWNQATQEVLKEHGIETYNKGKKLYYKDPDGNDVKISSPEEANGHLWTYLNIDCDYLKAYDYYKEDREKLINDPHAYGLKKNYPEVSYEVVSLIVQRFAELTALACHEDNYTPEELGKLSEIEPIMSSEAWALHADRDDFDYWDEEMAEGYEFEITLKSKSDDNVVPLSVQHKELDFFYQPRIRDENSFRPAFVEGSYVAYHKTKMHDKYMAGKAFHLYRPWAVDATGKKVWCSFDPNWSGDGDLEITVPQEFIDNAVYPITIDPTFGYTNSGGTGNNGVNKSYGALTNTTGLVGTVTYFSAFFSQTSGVSDTIDMVMGLYVNSTQTRADYTAQQVYNAAGSSAWSNFATQVGVATTAVGYDIGVLVSAVGSYTAVILYYDTGASGSGSIATGVTYSSPPPATEPTLTAGTQLYSVYMNTGALTTNLYFNETGVSITETVNIATVDTIKVSDTISVTDTVKVATVDTISVSDTASITESISVSVTGGVSTLSISVSDTVTPTESVTVYSDEDPNVSDSVSPTESLTLLSTAFISVSDSLSPTETLKLRTDDNPSISDTITPTESLSIGESATIISVSDSITPIESLKILDTDNISVSDTITVSDSDIVVEIEGLSVSDSVSPTESLKIEADEDPNVADSVSPTESITVNESATLISVSDSLSPSESLNIMSDEDPNVSDSVSPTDSVTIYESVSLSVSDTISPIDSVTIEVDGYISVSDSVSPSETITVSLPASTLHISVFDVLGSTVKPASIIFLTTGQVAVKLSKNVYMPL